MDFCIMRFTALIFLLYVVSSSANGQSDSSTAVKGQEAPDDYIERTIKQASELKKKGKAGEALKELRQAQQVADSLDNATLIQQVNVQIADAYLIRSQLDRAEKLLNQTLSAYPNGSKKAETLNMLGNTYRYKGQYGQALEKQNQAEALIDSAENPRMLGEISLSKGTTYSNMGDQGLALQQVLKTIKVAEMIEDSSLLVNGLNNVGLIYYNQSEYEEAKYYFKRAVEVSKDIGHKVSRYWALSNLAMVNGDLGYYDEALTQHDKTLALHREIKGNSPPIQIYHNMGNTYRKRGDFSDAEKYYRRSLDHSQKMGIAQGVVYNYGGLGELAREQQNWAEAKQYHEKALEAARSIGASSLEIGNLKTLSELAEKQGDYKQALVYYKQFNTLSDSLKQADRERELERTEARLDLRKQEQINQLLQDKQQQQQARLTTQSWLIASGIAIILVILISLYLLYRSYKQKQQINNELEAQRNQLEEISRVKDKMLAILTHDLRSPMASIKGLLYLFRETDLSQEEVQERAAELELAIDQNISMMDNLLAWAREQMNGLELDLEQVKASEIIEYVIDNYQLQADSKGVELRNKISSEVTVCADRNLLNLILRNLVSNAIKFSEEGDQVNIKSRTVDGEVILEVEDTGIGIPTTKQDELFSFNGDSRKGTNNEKGSGLGLQLCKEFIEKQGGEIAIQSTEGEGTTFRFSLPKAS